MWVCMPVCVPVCVGKGSLIRFNPVTALKRRQFFYPSLPPCPKRLKFCGHSPPCSTCMGGKDEPGNIEGPLVGSVLGQ